MPTLALPKYPVELTRNYWKKNKSADSKSGVGDLIDKLESAFKKARWENYDASRAKDLVSFEKTLKSLDATHITPVEQAATKLINAISSDKIIKNDPTAKKVQEVAVKLISELYDFSESAAAHLEAVMADANKGKTAAVQLLLREREDYKREADQSLEDFKAFVEKYKAAAPPKETFNKYLSDAEAEFATLRKTNNSLATKALASRGNPVVDKVVVTKENVFGDKRLIALLNRCATLQSEIGDLAKTIKIKINEGEAALESIKSFEHTYAIQDRDATKAWTAREKLIAAASTALVNARKSIETVSYQINDQIKNEMALMQRTEVGSPEYKQVLFRSAAVVKELQLKESVVKKDIKTALNFAPSLQTVYRTAQQAGDRKQMSESLEPWNEINALPSRIANLATSIDKYERLVTQRVKSFKATGG